jgi:nitroreductase
MKKDICQERYVAHQKRKKSQLVALLDSRSSQRVFNDEEIGYAEISKLVENMAKTPSSCGRQAIFANIIQGRNEKELLGALLVGGVGWIHRASKIILLFADPMSYKERVFAMPYLDAGVVVGNAYLICEDMGIGCCFVNPNIREENEKIFRDRFMKDNYLFCGALALGYYDQKADPSPKKKNIIIK